VCKQEKALDEFHKDCKHSLGIRPQCKICANEYFVERTKVLKRLAFEKYSGARCKNCGNDNFDVLVIDHVANDGHKKRKVEGTGFRLYYYLKRNNWPPGYQVLCSNCNFLKSNYPELMEKYAEHKNR
jgi:hypothetical protein